MLSYFGRIIEQCKALLKKLEDKDVILKFVKRSTNDFRSSSSECSHFISDRIWGPEVVDPELIQVIENDVK